MNTYLFREHTHPSAPMSACLPAQSAHDLVVMVKQRKWIIVLIFGILAPTLMLALLPDRGPSYQGRSLQAWLAAYRTGDIRPRFSVTTREQLGEQPRKEQSQAADAVRQIGEKAIPSLLNWMQYQRPAWKRRLAGVVLRIGNTPIDRWCGTQAI